MRVFQQVAIADAVSGGGRIEITAGRGSSVMTFPLFGHGLNDYDGLYAHKLDLLMTLNNSADGIVTWRGERRSAAAAGHSGDDIKVSVAALGLVAPTTEDALDRMYQGWYNLNLEMGRLRGWPGHPAPTTSAIRMTDRAPARVHGPHPPLPGVSHPAGHGAPARAAALICRNVAGRPCCHLTVDQAPWTQLAPQAWKV